VAAYCKQLLISNPTPPPYGRPESASTHIKDTIDFFAAVDDGTCRGFLRHGRGLLDGHPASSKPISSKPSVSSSRKCGSSERPIRSCCQYRSDSHLWTRRREDQLRLGYIQPLDFSAMVRAIPMSSFRPYPRPATSATSTTDHVSILQVHRTQTGPATVGPLAAATTFRNPKSDMPPPTFQEQPRHRRTVRSGRTSTHGNH